MGTTNKKQLVVGKFYRVKSGHYTITKIGSIVKVIDVGRLLTTIKLINTPSKEFRGSIDRIYYDLKNRDLEEL
jgi:hypothetical protein